MVSRRPLLALCFAALAAAACNAADRDPTEAADGAEPVGESAGELVAGNGISINGISINGISINGISINGISINGISINGISINGSQLSGVSLDGSELEGGDLVGAELPATLADGSSLKLRVDAVRAEADTWFYQVSYPSSSGRQALCGLEADGRPREALALAGRWDYRQGVSGGGSWINDPKAFTFACRGATLAKCAELGYRPWASKNGTSLRDHHQACVRMLRADYCGDGRGYTVNGTTINLYDNLGVQADTQPWKIEAEWTPNGARFVTNPADARLSLLNGAVPSCYAQRISNAVGDAAHFATGTLLISEYKH